MKTLSKVKKEMLHYAHKVVDLEEGETPQDWVDIYIEALREDGLIITIDGIEYVKED